MDGRRNCGECGTGFRGRSDALYCSSACRQKAHRGRTAKRIAALVEPRHPHPQRTVATSQFADTIRRARNEQRRARDLCRDAVDAQRRAYAWQQRSLNRKLAAGPDPTTSSPWAGWTALDREAGGRT